MQRYIPVLKKTKLFAGVGDAELVSMLSCLDARLRTYQKGEYVLRQGRHLHDVTVLADGSLHIQKDDYWGNRSILGRVAAGEIFGEAYIAPESGPLPPVLPPPPWSAPGRGTDPAESVRPAGRCWGISTLMSSLSGMTSIRTSPWM